MIFTRHLMSVKISFHLTLLHRNTERRVDLYRYLQFDYHSRFISEGVAEASQKFSKTLHLNYLAMSNTADVTGGKPIAV
jgi:hypothetical protein